MSGSRPVRVALIDNFEVSVAGVRSLLTPYSARVALLDLGSAMTKPSSVDVILYEPVRQTPSSQAMLRDLVRASQKSAVVYSWRDKAGQATGSFAAAVPASLPPKRVEPRRHLSLQASRGFKARRGRDEPGVSVMRCWRSCAT